MGTWFREEEKEMKRKRDISKIMKTKTLQAERGWLQS